MCHDAQTKKVSLKKKKKKGGVFFVFILPSSSDVFLDVPFVAMINKILTLLPNDTQGCER